MDLVHGIDRLLFGDTHVWIGHYGKTLLLHKREPPSKWGCKVHPELKYRPLTHIIKHKEGIPNFARPRKSPEPAKKHAARYGHSRAPQNDENQELALVLISPRKQKNEENSKKLYIHDASEPQRNEAEEKTNGK